MSTNIELKARYPDLQKARNIVLALGAEQAPAEKQHDTYFVVPSGRLKLRRRQVVSRPAQSEMIWYRRPDQAGPRGSDYTRVSVQDGLALMELLSDALGRQAEVVKQRAIYMHEGVRIHLDEVVGLGSFIEFEAIVDEQCDAEQARQKVERLQAQFEIDPASIVAGSYCDLE
jgi:predicted adenylyl cyclase CyaB